MSLTNEMAAVLAEQHFAALAAGDAELAARCIHPDNVNHMAADEPPACATPGVPGFLATSAWLRLAFSDLSFEIIELTADAGRTMAHVRMSGRQTGPFVVFPPGARPVVFASTGLAFGVRQVHVFRHRDGRHGEHIAVRDDLAMMTQLRHLPPSPTAAWRMARTALTGYRARAVREAIRVSTDAAAGGAAAVPSDRSLRAAPRHQLVRSSHLDMSWSRCRSAESLRPSSQSPTSGSSSKSYRRRILPLTLGQVNRVGSRPQPDFDTILTGPSDEAMI